MRYIFRRRVSNFDMRREMVARTRLTRARMTSLVSFVTRLVSCPTGTAGWERERHEKPRGNISSGVRIYVRVCVRVAHSNPSCFVSPPFAYGKEGYKMVACGNGTIRGASCKKLFYALPVSFTKEEKTLYRRCAHAY